MDEYFQQHPIPQQISSYEFRLVGDMTIKQFFQVAAGALVALFFYSTGLPIYFKFPLILISFLTGLALAFLPLQDRPLSQWIILFLKSIYTPTIFIWNKPGVKPEYFQSDTPPVAQPAAEVARPDVKIPSVSVPKIPTHQEPVTTPSQVAQVEEKVAEKPAETEKILYEAPESARLEKSESEFLSRVEQQFSTITIDTQTPVVTVVSEPKPEVARTPVSIPQQGAITVEKTQKPTIVAAPELQNASVPKEQYKVTPLTGTAPQNTKTPEFSSEGTPPAPPSTPNIIVGQVIDPTGKIVEGAIIEVKDADGRPVRALKTNKLGHFMIATPLTSGRYAIITEKDGMDFDHVEIEAKGALIPPIAIRAKSN